MIATSSTPTETPAIDELIDRARAAQEQIAEWSQEVIDELVTAVAWAVVRPDRARELARLAVDEAGFGTYDDKVTKISKRVTGVLADMRGVRTVGIVDEDSDRGIITIAKPVGVVAALVPVTGPDATPPVKALHALKGRNAIIVAPHPRGAATTQLAVNLMRGACEQVGAPADLVQTVARPSIDKTRQLMVAADLVVATGGAGMVQAAYSSGTPAYGVGVGNAVHVVDETSDLDDAADTIAAAKTFDLATSCLADNAVVAHADVADDLRDRLIDRGAHWCDPAQTERLQAAMWPEGDEVPSGAVIAQPAGRIAELAGFAVPDDRTFLVVEESGAGPDHPFSGEKLSVVLAFYRYDGGIEAASALVNAITGYQGLGHTCGIHTLDADRPLQLALATKTARVLVNQNLNEGAGSSRNALPFTLSLSCGTWGGNITTENVNARHFVNLTRLVRPIAPVSVSEDELFAAHWQRHGR